MKEGHDLRIVVPIKGNIAADIGISKTLDEPDFTIESYEIIYGFPGA